MNKTLFVVPLLILCLLAPTACRAEKTTTAAPTPTTLASFLPSTYGTSDYLMPIPGGGWWYESDSIPEVDVTLGTGLTAIGITYRSVIESAAGQTRNNILNVSVAGRTINATATVIGLPAEITAKIDNAGHPMNYQNEWQGIIELGISSTVKPGKYDFKIDINIDGTDYGTIPCTINVT